MNYFSSDYNPPKTELYSGNSTKRRQGVVLWVSEIQLDSLEKSDLLSAETVKATYG